KRTPQRDHCTHCALRRSLRGTRGARPAASCSGKQVGGKREVNDESAPWILAFGSSPAIRALQHRRAKSQDRKANLLKSALVAASPQHAFRQGRRIFACA